MSTHSKQTGFTLIEILVVIGILGALASLGYISIGSSAKQVALDTSHATVITAFESARSNAMRGAGDGTGGQTVEISADGKSIITEATTLPLPIGITIDQAGNTLTFERISGEASNNVTYTLTNTDGQTRTVTITPEGYVE